MLALVGAAQLRADVVTIKFTTDALGLGSTDLNGGGTVDPDIAGKFITSPVTGQGSILYVQKDGVAGLTDLLMTVTAKTYLDVTSGVPSPSDYHAGVLYMTDEKTGTPDGRDEGLGVRAFTVDKGTKGDPKKGIPPTSSKGLREIDAKSGRAKIEGSKEVSGGTDPTTSFDPVDPNGAPHVDELVNFAIDSVYEVLGESIEVTFSMFNATDRIWLHLDLDGGGILDYTFIGPGGPEGVQFTDLGNSVWNLNFAGLTGLSSTDIVRNFYIRAIDDDPSHPTGTAEHFLITGLKMDARLQSVVPEPASAVLFATAAGSLLAYRGFRRRREKRAADAVDRR